jgi:hypothetical protein
LTRLLVTELLPNPPPECHNQMCSECTLFVTRVPLSAPQREAGLDPAQVVRSKLRQNVKNHCVAVSEEFGVVDQVERSRFKTRFTSACCLLSRRTVACNNLSAFEGCNTTGHKAYLPSVADARYEGMLGLL